MFLADTNIFLEVLLAGKKLKSARLFLLRIMEKYTSATFHFTRLG
jgi:hypothetical protein